MTAASACPTRVPPAGAPNVLLVLYDDVGLAAWSPFGGRIHMPALQRIADRGLLYSQWHTAGLSAPTRYLLLTGRHSPQGGSAGGGGALTSAAGGYRVPLEHATLARVLRDAGWTTFWLGKNHNVPPDEWHMLAPKKHWPLRLGYDHFYGFIAGETNQWYPDLVENHRYIEQPYTPEQGYHLSKDLADRALSLIRRTRLESPRKPWYLWFCPGANHRPHHAPRDYIDRYKGQFDDGYDSYREWALRRMIQRGILPATTRLTPHSAMLVGRWPASDLVPPWHALSRTERQLYSRMAEVYAGFSEYTDAQVGRILDYLEASKQLDDTLIVYCGLNGASVEDSLSRRRSLAADVSAEPRTLLQKLGGPECYDGCPTGWSIAFCTPFQSTVASACQGRVCDPLVISWPRGIEGRGALRDQYHHVSDIVPTILDCCGVTMPDIIDGVRQTPLAGVSMRYCFDDACASSRRELAHYAMLGSRGLWHRGWKAISGQPPVPPQPGNERWQLFHTDVDRSESVDLAERFPERLESLAQLWFEEARQPLRPSRGGSASARMRE